MGVWNKMCDVGLYIKGLRLRSPLWNPSYEAYKHDRVLRELLSNKGIRVLSYREWCECRAKGMGLAREFVRVVKERD